MHLINCRNNLINNEIILQQPAKNFFIEPVKIEEIHKNLFNYVNSLRGNGKRIITYLLKYRKATWLSITNERIAQDLNICIRTVQRWTARFNRESVVLKYQVHQRAVNDYYLADTLRGSTSYRLWFANQTDKTQEFILNSVTPSTIVKTPIKSYRLQTVTLNKNIYIYNNYNKIKSIQEPINACAREGFVKQKPIDGDGYGFLSPKVKARLEYKQGVRVMIKRELKDKTISQKDDPNIRERLFSPAGLTFLFNPAMNNIATLLGFDFRTKLKLHVYDPKVLEYTYNMAKDIFGGKQHTIKDRVGWFFSVCDSTSLKWKLETDWRWYFELCKMMKIESLPQQGLKPSIQSTPTSGHVSERFTVDTTRNKSAPDHANKFEFEKIGYCTLAAKDVPFDQVYENLSSENKLKVRQARKAQFEQQLERATMREDWFTVSHYEKAVALETDIIAALMFELDSSSDSKIRFYREKIAKHEASITSLRENRNAYLMVALVVPRYEEEINNYKKEIDKLLGEVNVA